MFPFAVLFHAGDDLTQSSSAVVVVVSLANKLIIGSGLCLAHHQQQQHDGNPFVYCPATTLDSQTQPSQSRTLPLFWFSNENENEHPNSSFDLIALVRPDLRVGENANKSVCRRRYHLDARCERTRARASFSRAPHLEMVATAWPGLAPLASSIK